MSNKAPAAPNPVAAGIDSTLAFAARMMTGNPEVVADPAFRQVLTERVLAAASGDAPTIADRLLFHCLTTLAHNEQMKGALGALKAEKPALAWVLSEAFPAGHNGDSRQLAYVAPHGRSGVPEIYALVGDADEPDADPDTPPERPYRAFVDMANKLLLAPADDVPPLPHAADLLEAVSVRMADDVQMGEVEVQAEGGGNSTAWCTPSLAAELAERIESGDRVVVRIESGVATAIHKEKERPQEEFIEYPDLKGQGIWDMVWPAALAEQLEEDIENIVAGVGFQVFALGPTGVGKTTSVVSLGRTATLEVMKKDPQCKGLAIVKISGFTVGSSYIHETERNMARAVRAANRLKKDGYVVLILWDEADAMLGEFSGQDHSHRLTERLAAQQLFREAPDIPVFATANCRLNSWVAGPIASRFMIREFPRAGRGQLARIAALYAAPKALEKLELAADAFGGMLADSLFSEDRLVGHALTFNGARIPIRARDLVNCCPRKVEDLVRTFCRNVERGRAAGMADLFEMVTREFRCPGLQPHNLYDLTFLSPGSEAIRAVELVR